MIQNRRKYLAVLIMLMLSGILASQTVTVTGEAPGAEGKTIVLTTAADLITNIEKELAHADIDYTGQFTLTAEIRTPVLAILNIDFHRADLFLEPGKSVFVKCSPMNYKVLADINPLIESQSIQIQFPNPDPDNLNTLVGKYSVIYNAFLFDNFNALYRDRQKAKLDSFKMVVSRAFPTITNDYFAGYVKYRLAALELLAHAKSVPQLAKQYFIDPPVLYENTEYMDFFNQFFEKYLTATSRSFRYVDFPKIITTINSYPEMMKTLAKDTLLIKPQIREMVMLKALMEMFNLPGYDKESILSLLRTVAAETKFEGNSVIARDIVTYLTRLRPGTPAPPFTLYDRDKKAVSLKDFKGKPVLLTFWTTYCQSCLSDMDILKKLQEKYGDKIRIVSVSADYQYLKMQYFLMMKKDFNWTFLHLGDQLHLLKDYDVRSYPLYVLIDEQGNIYKYPAESPGSGLDGTMGMIVSP
jgi:thiol-disulfide isomerase/thioredoxin